MKKSVIISQASKWIFVLIGIAFISVFSSSILFSETTQDTVPLVFLGNEHLAPMVYIENNIPKGIVVDIIVALEDKIGHPIEIKAMNWSEAQEIVEQGGADALIQINETEERKKIYDFSEMLLESKISMFANSNAIGIAEVTDLKGLKVGVESRGFPELILENDTLIELVNVPNILEGFHLLKEGSIDVVVVDQWVGEHILATNKISDIRIVGSPITQQVSSIAVKKGNIELLETINDGLREMKEDGTYQRILKNWESEEVLFLTKEQIRINQLQIGIGVLILFVVVTIVWIFVLTDNFSKLKQAKRALQDSERKLKAVFESSFDAIIIMNKANKVIDCNERAVSLFGFADKEEFSKYTPSMMSPLYQPDGQTSLDVAQKINEETLEKGFVRFEWLHLSKSGEILPVEIIQNSYQLGEEVVLQASIRDINERKQTEQKIIKYNQELKELNHQIELEMEKAWHIHERNFSSVLPTIPGMSFATYYQPAKKLGGDFYSVAKVENKMVVYLSDVTGHGLDGAMLSVFVKSTINSYLNLSSATDVSPDKIVTYLSKEFSKGNIAGDYFICIFLAVLDLETMELSYTGAGFQDSPLVSFANGQQCRLVSKGLFLSPEIPIELLNLQVDSITLTPGATVLFNTDGITEQEVAGTLYGERLPSLFWENSFLAPGLLSQVIQNDFRQCNNNTLQGEDDITFLIMQVDPVGKTEHHMEYNSTPDQLQALQTEVESILAEFKDDGMLDACLYELASNAMEHGNRFDSKKKVFVNIVITDERIQICIEDQGPGFDWQEKINKPFDLTGLKDRGRGIAMTKILSDKLYYNDKGNKAFLVINARRRENTNAN